MSYQVNRYARPATGYATSPSGSLPASPSGWWKVSSGNKSWKFSDRALAQQCVAHFQSQRAPVSVSPSRAPDMRWRSAANPRPGNYR